MSDFLKNILNVFDPSRLLADPRADGAGVRVGIIDSGIDRELLNNKLASDGRPSAQIEGVLFRPGQPEPQDDQGKASAPHGTTVADIVLTLAPRVTLFSADVFGPTGGGDVESVVRAIYHSMDHWNCHVINLSLGISESRLQPVNRRIQLQRAIEEAYHRGSVVVAAAPNDHPLSRSYPAAFAPPLFSVDKELFDDRLQVRYAPRDHVEFQAHGRGYLGPFAREPATSWAAPHLAGIAARILSLAPELRPFEVKAILSLMSRARKHV